MNEDQKLLEMAAKAAAIHPWIHCFGVPPYMGLRLSSGAIWNPLTDDGDALRLAVKLGIALDRTTNRCWAWVNGWSYPGVCEEFYKNDPYAATRRAIVRAAAAIGGGK